MLKQKAFKSAFLLYEIAFPFDGRVKIMECSRLTKTKKINAIGNVSSINIFHRPPICIRKHGPDDLI